MADDRLVRFAHSSSFKPLTHLSEKILIPNSLLAEETLKLTMMYVSLRGVNCTGGKNPRGVNVLGG